MIKWISKVFIGCSLPEYRKRGNLMIESDSDAEADMVSKCYQSNGIISGSIDENGKLHIED